MKEEELTQKWLWMQAMAFGCQVLTEYAPKAEPTKNSYDDILRERYKYVLENWEEVLKRAKQGHSGRGSAYGRYFLGQSDHVRRSGIESSIRHKGMSVTVTWSEIRAFIQDMLKPDQQLSMFDLLLEGACS